MGTTADKLQNILNAKNAIKEKFSIGDDVKFIDYADNIDNSGIKVPDNFTPAADADVYQNKEFFHADGTLGTGRLTFNEHSLQCKCQLIDDAYQSINGFFTSYSPGEGSFFYSRNVRFADVLFAYRYAIIETHSDPNKPANDYFILGVTLDKYVNGEHVDYVLLFKSNKIFGRAIPTLEDYLNVELFPTEEISSSSTIKFKNIFAPLSTVIESNVEFYKCTAVFTDGTAGNGGSEDSGSSTDIIVNGCDYTVINGTYKLTEETKNNTGKERQWYNTSDPSITIHYDAGWWCIGKYGDYTMAWVHSDADDPVSISSDFGSSDVDFTNPPKLVWASGADSDAPEVSANTWSGRKAKLTTQTETITVPGGVAIVISGTQTTDGDGTYLPYGDKTATGYERIWKHSERTYYIRSYAERWYLGTYASWSGWPEAGSYIAVDAADFPGAENPWDVEVWERQNDNEVILPIEMTTQTLQDTVESKTETFYELEDTLTEGLTYGNGLTPVVGGIYDTKAMISVDEMYRDIKSENSGSGSIAAADFYLCGYVNRNYFSYNTIVVSGMPTNLFVGSTFINTDTWESAEVPADIAARNPNGTYTLQNPADNYGYWWWKSENGCIIDKYDMGQPIIYPDENCKRTDKYVMVPMNEETYTSYDYPVPDDYTSYTWELHDGSIVNGGSAVVPKPAEVEKYWEGYKLVLNDEGKYDLAAEKTKLTYSDYMPVAGRMYDSTANVEITNANLSDDALWSCPHGMTSNENDEWKVTSSGQYSDNNDWKAFDGNFDNRWWSNNTTSDNPEFWIQWQNKKHPVSFPELYIYCDDMNDFNDGSFLQASNNGTDWVDIVRGKIGSGESGMGTTTYENGRTKIILPIPLLKARAYYYWRLGKNRSSGYKAIVYEIQAYTQLPREVPK